MCTGREEEGRREEDVGKDRGKEGERLQLLRLNWCFIQSLDTPKNRICSGGMRKSGCNLTV